MEREKETGSTKEKRVFIIYLEDNGEPVSSYVHIIERAEGLITFENNKNRITIPTSRIIKIKEKLENDS
jgi:hypothetical protein